jgi:hypothetical protein
MTDLRKAAEQALAVMTAKPSSITSADWTAAITALRAALEQPQDALRRWANTDDGPPKTAWQGGYDAARRWVREVGLPALAEPTITQDKARGGHGGSQQITHAETINAELATPGAAAAGAGAVVTVQVAAGSKVSYVGWSSSEAKEPKP